MRGRNYLIQFTHFQYHNFLTFYVKFLIKIINMSPSPKQFYLVSVNLLSTYSRNKKKRSNNKLEIISLKNCFFRVCNFVIIMSTIDSIWLSYFCCSFAVCIEGWFKDIMPFTLIYRYAWAFDDYIYGDFLIDLVVIMGAIRKSGSIFNFFEFLRIDRIFFVIETTPISCL